jgi:flagellar basal body P-ring formation protein FlgA
MGHTPTNVRFAPSLAVVLAFLLGGAASVTSAQSVIELRSSARAEPGEAIALKQIANLIGADAESFGEAEVLGATERGGAVASTVTLEQVRTALQRAGRPNWGRIALRGGSCEVLTPISCPAIEPAAAPIRSQLIREAPTQPGTLRAAVAARIAQITQADPAELRLTFSPDDADLLSLPTAGRTLEIKPTASSERLPLAITVYEGERIVVSRSIRVGVLVQRKVVLASAAKTRGDTISATDVTTDTQWLPLGAAPATMEQVLGAAVKSKIASGQLILAEDVTAPMIVAKGDQVTVHCLSGGVVVTTRGRALSAARDGEVIEFQALDSKRRFFARMAGRGRAVVTATNDQEFTR